MGSFTHSRLIEAIGGADGTEVRGGFRPCPRGVPRWTHGSNFKERVRPCGGRDLGCFEAPSGFFNWAGGLAALAEGVKRVAGLIDTRSELPVPG